MPSGYRLPRWCMGHRDAMRDCIEQRSRCRLQGGQTELDNQRDYHICPLTLSVSTLSDSLHVSFPLPVLSHQYVCDAHVSMWYATRTSPFLTCLHVLQH